MAQDQQWLLSHCCFQPLPRRNTMAKRKGKQIYSTKLVQLKKMTPHVKKLGKRASKTTAVKG
jgi:hypothetical protein